MASLDGELVQYREGVEEVVVVCGAHLHHARPVSCDPPLQPHWDATLHFHSLGLLRLLQVCKMKENGNEEDVCGL